MKNKNIYIIVSILAGVALIVGVYFLFFYEKGSDKSFNKNLFLQSSDTNNIEDCVTTCGDNAFKTREILCVDDETEEPIDNSYCNFKYKPLEVEKCKLPDC